VEEKAEGWLRKSVGFTVVLFAFLTQIIVENQIFDPQLLLTLSGLLGFHRDGEVRIGGQFDCARLCHQHLVSKCGYTAFDRMKRNLEMDFQSLQRTCCRLPLFVIRAKAMVSGAV
jgi:hypothetical protein